MNIIFKCFFVSVILFIMSFSVNLYSENEIKDKIVFDKRYYESKLLSIKKNIAIAKSFISLVHDKRLKKKIGNRITDLEKELELLNTNFEFMDDFLNQLEEEKRRQKDKLKSGKGSKKLSYSNEPISEQTYSDLLQTLKGKTYEKDKVLLILTARKYQFYTTNQAIEILKQFLFTKDRLSVLKMLVPKIIDRENLFKTLDVFEYQIDKEKAQHIIEES